MDQFDIFRKNILKPKAIDGVRVAATDFHETIVPIAAGETPDFLSRLRNQFGFAKLINKSHADPPSQAGRGQASIQVGVAYFELGSFNVVGFDVIFVLQAVALDLLHGSIDFAQRAQRVHLVESIALADLAHGKADMDQHPVAGHGPVVLQQAKVNLAPHTDDINQRQFRIVAGDFDDLSWYG
jgi:hypothetical protein